MLQNFASTVARCTTTRQIKKSILLYEGVGNLENYSGVIARAVKQLNVSANSEGLNECLQKCVFVEGMDIQDAVDVIEMRAKYSTRLSESQLNYMEESFMSQFHKLRDCAIPIILKAYITYSVAPRNFLARAHPIACDTNRFTLQEISTLMEAYLGFGHNPRPLLLAAATVVPIKTGPSATWMSLLRQYTDFDGKWKSGFLKPVFQAAAREIDTRNTEQCYQCVMLFHTSNYTPPPAMMWSASRKKFSNLNQATLLATAFMKMKYFSSVLFDTLREFCHPTHLVSYVSCPPAAEYVQNLITPAELKSISYERFCLLVQHSCCNEYILLAIVNRLRYCDSEGVTDEQTEILVYYIMKYFPRHVYEMDNTWSKESVIRVLRAYQKKGWGGSYCVPNVPNPLARFREVDANNIILVAWSLVKNRNMEETNLLIHSCGCKVEDICDADFTALTYLFVAMARQLKYEADVYVEFVFDAIDMNIAKNGVPLEYRYELITILYTASTLRLQDLDHYLFLLSEAMAAKPGVFNASEVSSLVLAAAYYRRLCHPYLKILEQPLMTLTPIQLGKIASVCTAVAYDSIALRNKIFETYLLKKVRSKREIALLKNHFDSFRDERPWIAI